jgi:hypothetical protein
VSYPDVLCVIMAAANFSPAVASRRAKNDDDFRVPTLLGASHSTHTIDMAVEPEEG